MIKNLPIYEISIDLNNPETTVSMNSMVLDPAHELSFQLFNNQKRFHFNKVENVITGVAISADTPIYRYDDRSREEYYVVFTKQAIKDIIFDYARRGNFNNMNLDHSSKKVLDDAYMIHSYQIDEEKGFTAPERFKDANDGSWIVSYKVSDEIFAKAEAGEWTGFSVEGVFQLEETDMSIEDKMWSAISLELKKVQDSLKFFNDYPDAVSNNAKRGIELNENNNNKCATQVGKVRAQQLAQKENVSLETIKRMYSYLSRAEEYYDENNTTACGTISYLLWGGLAGKRWAESKLKELGELEASSDKFAKVRVSFDYDDTLTTPKGQQMASRYIAAGDNVFIITARQQTNGAPVYEMAKRLGIPRENVYFTGGRDKWQTVKRLRIDKHIDNNAEQIELIKENTEAEAIKF